jgi:hypothetical protein
MPKQVRGLNGFWVSSDIGFLGRWTEHSPAELADALWHVEKDQAVKAVLDKALPVLLQLRKLLQ